MDRRDLFLATALAATVFGGGGLAAILWTIGGSDVSDAPRAHESPDDRTAESVGHGEVAPSASTIAGRALLADGDSPVEGAQVTARAIGGGTDTGRHALTDPTGGFEFRDLADGFWLLQAVHEELVPVDDGVEVEPGRGPDTARLYFELGIDVAGKVRDAKTGRGIGDAEVVVTPAMENAVDSLYPSDQRVTRTAENGLFVVKGLADGAHEASVTVRGRPRTAGVQLLVHQETQPLDLIVAPGYEVSGRVLDRAGQPVAGATVRVHPSLDPIEAARVVEPQVTTDRLGRFSIVGLPAMGDVDLVASHEDFAMSWAFTGGVGPNAPSNVVEIQLSNGWSVRGRVMDEHGQSVSGVSVAAVIGNSGHGHHGASEDFLALGGIEQRRTITQPDGGFAIHHLGGRSYGLWVEIGGSWSWTRSAWGANVDDGGTVEDFNLYIAGAQGDAAKNSPRVTISGRVVDTHGQPVGHARLATDTHTVVDTEVSVTSKNGAFVARVRSGNDIQLTVSRKGFSEKAVWTPAPAENVEIVLERLAVLVGRVRAGAGPRVPASTVGLFAGGALVDHLDLQEGTEGRFEFELAAGEYVLQAESRGFSAGRADAIVLEPGERRDDVVLELLPEISLRGRAVVRNSGEPLGAIRVALRAASEPCRVREATSGPDGRFEFRGLPAGEFEITAVDREWVYADRSIRGAALLVGEARELEIEFDRGVRLSGIFTEGGRPPGERFSSLSVALSRRGRSVRQRHLWAGGEFELNGITPGAYELCLSGTYAEGGRFCRAQMVEVLGPDVTRIAIDESARKRVRGRVTSGGKAVPDLIVQMVNVDALIDCSDRWGIGSPATTKTGENGDYEVELRRNRNYVVSLRSKDQPGQTLRPLFVPHTNSPFVLDISLPAGRLAGSVVHQGRAVPLRGAVIEIVDPRDGIRSWLSVARAMRGRCTTDGNGRFVVDHLTPGDYLARVLTEWSGTEWQSVVATAPDDSRETTLEVKPRAYLGFSTSDERGCGIGDAIAFLRDSQGRFLGGLDPVGVFGSTLTLHPVPGAYELTVLRPDYYPVRRLVTLDIEPEEVAVTLGRGGRLTVRLVDLKGEPVPEATVAIVDQHGRSHFDDRIAYVEQGMANPFPAPRTSLDGTLVVPDLKPDRYRVLATLNDARSKEIEVEVEAEQSREVRLVLPRS